MAFAARMFACRSGLGFGVPGLGVIRLRDLGFYSPGMEDQMEYEMQAWLLYGSNLIYLWLIGKEGMEMKIETTRGHRDTLGRIYI